MALRSFFANVFRPFLSEGQPSLESSTVPVPRSLHDVEGDLDALEDEADKRRKEEMAKAAMENALNGAVVAGLSEVALTEARRKVWRVERAKQQERLCEEIEALHVELGTGLSRDGLSRLARLLKAHGPADEAPPHASVEQRIEASVVAALSRRTADRAWRRLNELMTKRGVSWPIPDGLNHSRTGEELAVAAAQHYEEVRRDFVNAPASRLAGLVRGDVAAWAYAYPPPDGYLWKKTALCGVAAGLHAQLFAAAVEVWMWRPPELEKRLLATLDDEASEAREKLRTGNGSLVSALDVASRVDELCRSAVPALVWSHVAPRLSWDGPGPTVPDLAGGLAHVDPVCGMTLTADKVHARTTRGEEVYYFCQPSCLNAFRMEPAGFAPS